jgi:hypothetical protein
MPYGRGSYSGRKTSFGIRTNSSGYQQFKDRRTGKWMLTHRRVAEKMVGGKIYPGREVHHVDGDKSNNRPSNLTILSRVRHRRIHRKR